MPESVFAEFEKKAWPVQYRGVMQVESLHAGVPADPNVAEKWVRAALEDKLPDAEIRDLIARTTAELRETNLQAGRTLSDHELEEKAIRQAVDNLVGLNVFKRDSSGLYIEGRQLKAALKEAVMIAANTGKISTKGWGDADNKAFHKQIKGWFPEHVHVVEQKLYLQRDGQTLTAPDGRLQKLIHTSRGDSIGYEEFADDVDMEFTIISDYEKFAEEFWPIVWLTGGPEGIGASRSQSYGRYVVTDWRRTR